MITKKLGADSAWLPWALALAVTAPTLLAYNPSPSATLLNQVLALAGWATVLICGHATAWWRGATSWRPAAPLLAALGVLVGAAWVSCLQGWPTPLALQSAGMLLAALAVVWVASSTSVDGDLHLFASGMALAGLVSTLIAMVQVFAPEWADGNWIARSGLPGRAVGNLRQPNHLNSLLLWGLIALVPLAETGRAFGQKLNGRLISAVAVLMVLAVVLTASRTGVLGMGVLALWGALDRRLPGRVRMALLLAPVVYGGCWAGMSVWSHHTTHAFGAEARLAETDLSASRFGIWANTLALIRQQPWSGVGFGEFNFAWTLTPFPTRPVAFFDHAHNLPLHLAAELGVPTALGVLGLMTWALACAGLRAWRSGGAVGEGARAAFMMVLMIGVHSMLEYPLWYAYFLLPTAWAWGVALRAPAQRDPAVKRSEESRSMLYKSEGPWATQLVGLVMLFGAVFVLRDYSTQVPIFADGLSDDPLAVRIERGQHSLLFSPHADYAAATTTEPPSLAMGAFSTVTHMLLDTRLMIAWARALHESGHEAQARYLADRLREFHNPDAKGFLAECDDAKAAAAPLPFQCLKPTADLTWRDFRK